MQISEGSVSLTRRAICKSTRKVGGRRYMYVICMKRNINHQRKGLHKFSDLDEVEFLHHEVKEDNWRARMECLQAETCPHLQPRPSQRFTECIDGKPVPVVYVGTCTLFVRVIGNGRRFRWRVSLLQHQHDCFAQLCRPWIRWVIKLCLSTYR